LKLTRYLVGASAARVASEGVAIALVLAVHAVGAGAAHEGLFVAAWSGPSLLSGVLAGHGLDRASDPRRFLALAGLVVAAALALDAVALGRLSSGLLLLTTAIGGAMVPLFTGGISSVLPGLVDRAGLARAQALDSATYSVSGIAGPALVALLAAAFSPRVALAVPAVAVVFGACVIPVSTHLHDPERPPRRISLRTTLAALGHTRELLSATVSSTVAAFGWGGLEIGAAAVAVLDSTPHLAGVYLATVAAAALVSALALTRFPLRSADRAIPISLVAMTAGAVIVAISSSALPSVLGFVLFGIGDGVLLPAVLAVRSRDAPPALTASVFTTAASLKTAAGALGAAIAGLALTVLGAHWLFYALAATQLLAAAIAAAVLAVNRDHGRQPLVSVDG
jgi:MFS family permease